jgi:VWFA-related protein
MPGTPFANLILLGGILLSSPPEANAEAAAGEPRTSSIEESVLVRRVHFPVFIEPTKKARRHPERCENLPPDAVLVTEDGARAEVTAIDETLHGTLHVILIDTSASMRTRLDRAKQAALRYVERLDPDEKVLVASFDDNLILRSPPSLDRDRVNAAIRGLEVGNNTALWDALHYLFRYLEPYPEQKVVVLLSDGEDSVSLRNHDYREIVRDAAATPNLTVFPIGLDLPQRSGIRGPDRRAILGELAHKTGGTFYEVKRVSGLSGAFKRIQRRLEGKSFVTYIPMPFGEGPLDEPELHESRWRKVEIRAAPGVPCRVISLAPPGRFEGRRESEDDLLEMTDGPEASRGAEALERGCFDPGRHRITGGILMPSTGIESEPGASTELWALDPPDTLLGHASDIVKERSFLYDDRYFRRSGRLRLRMSHQPTFAERIFAVGVPPLDELRQTLIAPEDILIRLLDQPSCLQVWSDGSQRESAWVHGQTFLELREAIGLALFRFYPGYGEWASRRMKEDGSPQVEALLSQLRQSPGATQEDLERAFLALEARAEDPDRNQPQRYLAEWLGDIPARELAFRVETRAAEAMLETTGVGLPDLSRTVVERWDELTGWLPPPTRVRILTPLLPAYDPDREVVGFYRVLLPVTRVGGHPVDQVPTAPFGVLTLRWLFDQAAIRHHHLGDLRLTSLDHARIPPSVSRRLTGGVREDAGGPVRPRPAHRVKLGLATSTSEEGRLGVTAYIASDPDLLHVDAGERGGPFCMRVETEGSGLNDLAGAISAWIARNDLDCPTIDE